MFRAKIDSNFQVKFPREVIGKTNLHIGDSLEIEVTQNKDIVLHKLSENILEKTFGILGSGPMEKDEVDSMRDEEEARLRELAID